ncbi:hypothetical protein GCM10010211_19970 [Streptomyces albospinus]|uniref:Uncharacterized protein n=1 Tax=Streptomyces albospinus TaxID=285515 RepID=A0ABQ2UXM4_9ACTN|nr:hypothetical protein [Streptomyces albospinus]GGU55285.1 hypothetical protein GCM10010211_19970 [Streptomyces albospinus]
MPVVPATAGLTTPTDPNGRYPYGRQVLALTDQLNGATSYEHAAALTDQVLEPTDGLLERLAEFFEAAAEKAKESDHDDGFDLHYDLDDAAATLRGLGEDLHVAVDRMRALAPRASARQATKATAAGSNIGLPTAVLPTPGRTR